MVRYWSQTDGQDKRLLSWTTPWPSTQKSQADLGLLDFFLNSNFPNDIPLNKLAPLDYACFVNFLKLQWFTQHNHMNKQSFDFPQLLQGLQDVPRVSYPLSQVHIVAIIKIHDDGIERHCFWLLNTTCRPGDLQLDLRWWVTLCTAYQQKLFQKSNWN